MNQDLTGKIVKDKYLIQKKIGNGNQAQVYLASILKDNPIYLNQEVAYVAIKVVNHDFLKPKEKELLNNEIKALQQIDSIYVVKCFECIVDKNNTFIVLEYCQDGSFDQHLKDKDVTKIPERFAKDIFRQILLGFQELHQRRIMHRDIKISNILVKDQYYKIGDLGFCKLLQKPDEICETILGSRICMAPELLKMQPYGIEAEMYSIGVLFYQIVQGSLPFNAINPYQLLKVVEKQELKFELISQGLQDLLTQMLKFKPEERIRFKDIFKHKFFTGEDNDCLFMNSSHLIDTETKNKEENHIKAYQNIENQIKPIKVNEDGLYEDQLEDPQLEDSQVTQVDFIKQANNPNVQINQQQNQNDQQQIQQQQIPAFVQFMNPINNGGNQEIKPIQPQPFTFNDAPRMNFQNPLNQGSNQFRPLSIQNAPQGVQGAVQQQPPFRPPTNTNFQPFALNQPPPLNINNNNPINQNPFQQQQLNNPPQINLQNNNNNNNNNDNNNVAKNNYLSDAKIQQQKDINQQNEAQKPAQLYPQLNIQNNILKDSSQQQFKESQQNIENKKQQKELCDALVRRINDIQQSYTYIFIAMRSLVLLSGLCQQLNIRFQTYIGAALFVLKQKCQNMNVSIVSQIEKQEYDLLRKEDPNAYRKIMKKLESDKQEIETFAFLAKEEYEKVKGCVYPIFNDYINQYIQNINRQFDLAYNRNLRTILIDTLLDIAQDKKVSAKDLSSEQQRDEMNKLIRDTCIYITLSIYADDNQVNILHLEQQLKSANYFQNLKLNLKQLISQTDETILITDVQQQERQQQKLFEEYLAKNQEKMNNGEEFQDFDLPNQEILFPLKHQFERRFNEIK